MKRSIAALGLLVLAMVAPAGPAAAAPFTDALSRCLVERTTPADKADLSKWIFASLALHPSVDEFVSITPAQRAAFDTQAGRLMVRLLTVDCRKETVAALKYEGQGAISSGFEVLGGAATTELMSDPAVTAGLENFSKSVDLDAMNGVLKEAGLPTE